MHFMSASNFFFSTPLRAADLPTKAAGGGLYRRRIKAVSTVTSTEEQ
jgi:hypothetical protein